MDPGPFVLVVVMLLLMPLLATAGLVVAGLLGWLLRDNGRATHEGSELVDLNN